MSQYGTTPVRPAGRRRPVVAIVLVILLGLGSSGAVLTVGVLKAIWKLPTPTAAYRLPGPARIGVEEPGEWAVYVRGEQASRSTSECSVATAEGTPVPVERAGTNVRTDRGGGSWLWVGTFEAAAAGDYTLTCRAVGATAMGIAERPDLRGFAGWLVGGILGSLALLGAGIVGGLYLAFKRR